MVTKSCEIQGGGQEVAILMAKILIAVIQVNLWLVAAHFFQLGCFGLGLVLK